MRVRSLRRGARQLVVGAASPCDPTTLQLPARISTNAHGPSPHQRGRAPDSLLAWRLRARRSSSDMGRRRLPADVAHPLSARVTPPSPPSAPLLVLLSMSCAPLH
jgi:hypothetical protein